MEIKIRLFASLKERLGEVLSLDVEGEPPSAKALLERLAERHPDKAASFRASRLAADGRFLGPQDRVPWDAELAVIPPVSGG